MTVRILRYAGDGSYFLRDSALELAPLRRGPCARTVLGEDEPVGLLRSMLARGGRSGRAAFDIVIAAPKPLSVLLALVDREAGREIVALHQRSVDAAFGYLSGPSATAVGGLEAVAFIHGINRLADPHLHAHVVVGALGGSGRPVPPAQLARRARAADALYLAELRAGLEAACARRSWIDGSGTFRVEGVDEGLVAAMSLPRDRAGRIELLGRKPRAGTETLLEQWRAAAARAPKVRVLEPPRTQRGLVDEHRLVRALGDGLVGAPELVGAWAGACTWGELAPRVLAATALLAPGATDRAVLPAVSLRLGRAVGALGARPQDPELLRSWLASARGVDRTVVPRRSGQGRREARIEVRRGELDP